MMKYIFWCILSIKIETTKLEWNKYELKQNWKYFASSFEWVLISSTIAWIENAQNQYWCVKFLMIHDDFMQINPYFTKIETASIDGRSTHSTQSLIFWRFRFQIMGWLDWQLLMRCITVATLELISTLIYRRWTFYPFKSWWDNFWVILLSVWRWCFFMRFWFDYSTDATSHL